MGIVGVGFVRRADEGNVVLSVLIVQQEVSWGSLSGRFASIWRTVPACLLRRHICSSWLDSPSLCWGYKAVLRSVYEHELSVGLPAGRRSTCCAKVLRLQIWPVTWSTARVHHVDINLSSWSSVPFGISSAMTHLGQLWVCMHLCLWMHARACWW